MTALMLLLLLAGSIVCGRTACISEALLDEVGAPSCQLPGCFLRQDMERLRSLGHCSLTAQERHGSP